MPSPIDVGVVAAQSLWPGKSGWATSWSYGVSSVPLCPGCPGGVLGRTDPDLCPLAGGRAWAGTAPWGCLAGFSWRAVGRQE